MAQRMSLPLRMFKKNAMRGGKGSRTHPTLPPRKKPLTDRLEILKKLKSMESNLCLYRSKHVVGAISVEYVLGK